MREKILQELKKSDFVSGQKLAKKLNVSRTAIWKQIKALKELGYQIKSVQNKGYKLHSKPDILIPEEIYEDLDTKLIGKKIIYYKEVDSTNLILKNLVKKKVLEGTVAISDFQKKGKGRKNRPWLSPKGGLWFSIILYPNIVPDKAMFVTMMFSVAISEAIFETCKIIPVIKWPNDLLIDNKKVCGILTELDAEIDTINHMIIGTGINVNNKIPKNLKEIAISIKDKQNKDISKLLLVRNILRKLDFYYNEFKLKNYDLIRNKWLEYSNILGKKIKVNQEKKEIIGKIVNIDQNGHILLKTNNGVQKIFTGDIKYL